MPFSFVVKNGSKIRAFVSGVMPVPVSLTASMTYGPGMTGWCSSAYCAVRSAFAVSRIRVPPVGIASRALTTRFMSTCWSWPGSARTFPASLPSAKRISTSSPMTRRSIFSKSSTSSLSSNTIGSNTCWRLKASSCLVSEAARSDAFRTSVRSRCAALPCGISSRSRST